MKRRPVRTDDAHERIRAEVATIRSGPVGAELDPGRHPELRALLETAMCAIETAVPKSIEHRGRRYWIRVRVDTILGIHDSPGSAEPMILTRCAGNWSGHRPGH